MRFAIGRMLAGGWKKIEERYYLNKSTIQLSKESVLNPKAYSFIMKLKWLRKVIDRDFDYPTKALLFITLSNKSSGF